MYMYIQYVLMLSLAHVCTPPTLHVCIDFFRCLSLKTCSDAISILDRLPQEKESSFVKGKAFFWQAVILHEQVVR